MKKKITMLSIIYLLLGAIYTIHAHETLHKAVIIQPVADLTGQPMRSLFKGQSVQSAYNHIPLYSQDIIDNQACARLHQLLFNEIVEIVETRGDEVFVQIPNMFYITHNSKQPHAKYWMHKSALMPLHTLHRKNIDISRFPKPISYRSHDINSFNKNSITLTVPFYDPVTKKTYSAGTRFVRNQSKDKKNKMCIHIFDTTMNRFKHSYLPKQLCAATPQTKQQSIQTFVSTLKKWAHPKNNKAIPYVWGGCSVINTFNVATAHEQKRTLPSNKTVTFYAIPKDKHRVKTGLDCTGMVARAAQIAGIPYFFKNSTTVAHNLRQLKKNEPVEVGDILWIPGHVMVVSDVKNNQLIEARAYEQGYGKIQEIPVHKQFKDMRTFNDLAHAIHNKKLIERLDKQGNVIKKMRNMRILKLSSVWK